MSANDPFSGKVIITEKAEVVSLVGVGNEPGTNKEMNQEENDTGTVVVNRKEGNGQSNNGTAVVGSSAGSNAAPTPTNNTAAAPMTIDEYKHAYETAQRVIAQAKNTTRNACKAAKAFQLQLADANKKLKMRELQLAKVQGSAAELQSENASLKGHLSERTEQCNSYEKEIVHLTTKVEDYESLDDSFQTAQETIQMLRKQLENAGITDLSSSSSAAAANQSTTGDAMSLQQTVEQLQSQLDNMRHELEKEQKESQSKQMQINTMRKQLKLNKARTPKEQAERIQEMADENTTLQREVEELGERFQSAAYRTQELELTVETYREKCSALQSKYEHVTMQLQAQQSPHEIPEEEEVKETPLSAGERENTLIERVKQLEIQLEQVKKDYLSREEMYQYEIETLKSQVEEYNSMEQDQDSAIAMATAPFLKKINMLKHQHVEQITAFQEVEQRLSKELAEKEEQLQDIRNDRSKLLSERQDLELTVGQLRARESSLMTSISTASEIKRDLNERISSLEEEITSLKREVEDLTTQNENLANLRNELESKLQEFHQKSRQRRHMMAGNLPGTMDEDSSMEKSKQGELESLLNAHQVPLVLSRSGSGASDNSAAKMGQDELQPQKNASGVNTMQVNQLMALLRQREGEVESLRKHVDSLSQSRNSLSNQLVALRSKNEELKDQASLANQLDESLRHISMRHEVALDVIGEKEDELQRMRDELVNLKGEHRKQTEELIEELKQLRREKG